MQELLQELYSSEKTETSFNLDMGRFQDILSRERWFKLQEEFETRHNSLSQSYLIWTEGSGQHWMLADFGREKTYYISSSSEIGAAKTDEADSPLALVSELPDLNNRLKDTQTICKLLRDPQTGQEPQGTLSGFITLMMKLDLGKVDLERLKRSDLSGSRLDFESVHQNLVVVHGIFREILTSSNVSDVTLSETTIQTVRNYLPKFYEISEEIEGFDVSGANPTERHAELLQKISNFCRDARSALEPIVAYLRSTQIEKSQTKFDDFFSDAVKKWEKFDNESEAKLQTLDELKLTRENQIATTSISDHVKFFDNQAKEHRDSARRWLKSTICMAIGFISTVIIFWFLIKPIGDQLTAILQNFFTKGFVISVFYMLLNRSIKNYTAEKHLEVVNLHRKNALATFEAFAAASGNNPHTRDQVLLASTNAIFDANQSGYLSAKTSRSDTASPIQHIIREIIPGKS